MDSANTRAGAGTRPIVAAWDGSDQARDAIALAATLARVSGAPVRVVRVGPAYLGLPDLEPAFEPDAERLLEQVPMQLLDGVESDRHLVTGRSPAEGLHHAIAECDAGLVVLGSTHHGALGRVIPGTVSGHLMHGSPSAVAIAPRGYADAPPDSLRTIAVAYDGSREARAAVERATDVATRGRGTLRVISVVTPPSYGWASAGVAMSTPPEALRASRGRYRAELDDLLAQLPAEVRADGRLLDGQPAAMILDECEKGVDLLVMGSRGYGTVGRVLLGSVSSRVIQDAPCPVLVVPHSATRDEAERDSRQA